MEKKRAVPNPPVVACSKHAYLPTTDQPTCIVCIVCSTLLPAHMHVSFATGGREREREPERAESERDGHRHRHRHTERERERPGQIIKMHPIPSTWKMNSGPATWRAPTSYFVPPSHTRRHRAPGVLTLGSFGQGSTNVWSSCSFSCSCSCSCFCSLYPDPCSEKRKEA